MMFITNKSSIHPAAAGRGDRLMLGAIIACGLRYAEGARLIRILGGWQVISWALNLAP